MPNLYNLMCFDPAFPFAPFLEPLPFFKCLREGGCYAMPQSFAALRDFKLEFTNLYAAAQNE